MSRSLLRPAALLALSLVSLPLAAEPDAAVRAAFAAAYAAPAADDAGDSEALRAYPLYPWLAAAQRRVALADGREAALAEALRFLDAAGEVPQVRELRRAVLSLAASRGDWPLFLAQWREAVSTETLACQRLDARIATGDTATLAQQIAERWVRETELPPACAAAINWLRAQPPYTPALVERRVRALLLDNEASRARASLAELPAERRARYEAWMRQLSSPATEFARLAAGPAQLLDSEGLTDAWMRWARKEAREAAALLPAFATTQKLSPVQMQTLQRNTALALAWSRDSAAVALFRQVPEALLDEKSYEWRIRAALWAGDWNQALNWIVLLPEPLAAQPRWRYWNARALDALGQKGEAFQRYTRLAAENDPYGLLAAWRAGKGWTPVDEPQPVTAEQRALLEATPAFVRAREAWVAGLKPIASLEWADAINTVPDAAKPALVREAVAMGWLDQAIVTGTRLGLFRDLEALFPRPYATLVRQSAKDAGIAPAWVYSVMRKESAFKPDASSSAGAIGLLQMLPGTAALTARAVGAPKPSVEDLRNPEINIPLGALHLREVLDKSNGRWQLALASYNAGFNAMKRWLPPQTMEADVWIENIPFNETRTYVQRILFHLGVYQWLETGKPVRDGNWFLPVEPALAP